MNQMIFFPVKRNAYGHGVLLLLIFTFFACGISEKQKEEALKKQVMDIHDTQMGKMGAIHALEKQLRSLVSGVEADTSATGMQLTERIYREIKLLENADEVMMDWMHNYKEPSEEMTHEQVMSYFNEQKNKIMEVGQKMEESMNKANKTIEESKVQ